jgi:hypothetical protein
MNPLDDSTVIGRHELKVRQLVNQAIHFLRIATDIKSQPECVSSVTGNGCMDDHRWWGLAGMLGGDILPLALTPTNPQRHITGEFGPPQHPQIEELQAANSMRRSMTS